MREDIDTTALLARWRDGDVVAGDRLLTHFYDELRGLAASQLDRDWGMRTLQATELVHEAWFRVCGEHAPAFENRRHFFGCAARAMRQILIDRARRRGAEKRGDGQAPVALEDVLHLPAQGVPVDLIVLDGLLQQLEKLDAEQVRLVELRYFLGLTIEQTADALGIHPSAVNRRWESARAWLLSRLST